MFSGAGGKPSEQEVSGIIERVKDHCSKVVEFRGPKSFHVGSTFRQFKRYHDSWAAHDLGKKIAETALDVLNPGGAISKFDYPDYD